MPCRHQRGRRAAPASRRRGRSPRRRSTLVRGPARSRGAAPRRTRRPDPHVGRAAGAGAAARGGTGVPTHRDHRGRPGQREVERPLAVVGRQVTGVADDARGIPVGALGTGRACSRGAASTMPSAFQRMPRSASTVRACHSGADDVLGAASASSPCGAQGRVDVGRRAADVDDQTSPPTALGQHLDAVEHGVGRRRPHHARRTPGRATGPCRR